MSESRNTNEVDVSRNCKSFAKMNFELLHTRSREYMLSCLSIILCATISKNKVTRYPVMYDVFTSLGNFRFRIWRINARRPYRGKKFYFFSINKNKWVSLEVFKIKSEFHQDIFKYFPLPIVLPSMSKKKVENVILGSIVSIIEKTIDRERKIYSLKFYKYLRLSIVVDSA